MSRFIQLFMHRVAGSNIYIMTNRIISILSNKRLFILSILYSTVCHVIIKDLCQGIEVQSLDSVCNVG